MIRVTPLVRIPRITYPAGKPLTYEVTGMGRLTKRQEQEYVQVVYGINRETFAVETAHITRGGSLEIWRGDQRLRTHVGMGRSAESEARIVFGLTEVIVMHVGNDDSATSKRIRDELKAKAEVMRTEAQAR
jgi:hypothetical protein